MPLRKRDDSVMRRMFETRSQAWREVGLARELTRRAARRAQRGAVLFVLLIAGVLVVYSYRADLFGKHADEPVRIATVIVLLALGWAAARDVGRALAPALFRRLDPGTAGTVGFLIRLGAILLVLLVALRIAGLDLRALAVGGAFTAVVVGLAAQQTLGNLIAGMVLLSARPFRVGERIALQGSGISVNGVVSSLGLLYTVLADGDDRIMIPNSIVLGQAVTPMREPDAVDLRARLSPDLRPSDVQTLLERNVTVPTRGHPNIVLEEFDGEELVVRISATPQDPIEGPKLADEILMAVSTLTDGAGNGSRSPAARRPEPAEPPPTQS
jgi:small-conductance mechanosensitive channel